MLRQIYRENEEVVIKNELNEISERICWIDLIAPSATELELVSRRFAIDFRPRTGGIVGRADIPLHESVIGLAARGPRTVPLPVDGNLGGKFFGDGARHELLSRDRVSRCDGYSVDPPGQWLPKTCSGFSCRP